MVRNLIEDWMLVCHLINVVEDKNHLCLPVWIDENGIKHYSQPQELRNLSEAEKMLISITDVFVPLHHLKGGQLGIQGHVCALSKVRTNCYFIIDNNGDTLKNSISRMQYHFLIHCQNYQKISNSFVYFEITKMTMGHVIINLSKYARTTFYWHCTGWNVTILTTRTCKLWNQI